jgi:long-chain fatty acid transport protein
MKLRKLTGCVLLSMPSGLMAAGYYLPNQDTFATARGNAYVATADSASAVFYNPAGMTQLERPELQAGVYSILMGSETNAGGTHSEADSQLQAVPQIYYAQPFNDRLSFGFGLNSPFGLGTDWGDGTPFSPVVTEVSLAYLSATSAVAYKVTDTLSLGASVSLNYADLMLEQGIFGTPAGNYLRYEGDDYAFSGSLSVRWQPHEQHAFALVYNTESSFDLDGKTQSNLLADDASAGMDFMTPARIAGGYSYRPAPGWNIELG